MWSDFLPGRHINSMTFLEIMDTKTIEFSPVISWWKKLVKPHVLLKEDSVSWRKPYSFSDDFAGEDSTSEMEVTGPHHAQLLNLEHPLLSIQIPPLHQDPKGRLGVDPLDVSLFPNMTKLINLLFSLFILFSFFSLLTVNLTLLINLMGMDDWT